MNIIPTNELGKRNLAEEMGNYCELIEDPNEILGKRLNLRLFLNLHNCLNINIRTFM